MNVCEDIVKLKHGNFQYRIGKVTPGMQIFLNLSSLRYQFLIEKLQSNSTSECYIKTNEELLNKLRTIAAKVTPNVPVVN